MCSFLTQSVQVCTPCSVLGRLLGWLWIVTDVSFNIMVSAGSHILEGNPPSFTERGANGAEKLWGFLRCLGLFATSLDETSVSLLTSVLVNGLYLSSKPG